MDTDHAKKAMANGHLPQPLGFRMPETGTIVRTPKSFSPQIAKRICKRLMDKESLDSICKDPRMPSRPTVAGWLNAAGDEFDAFREQYYQARRVAAELLVDEAIDIADDGSEDWIETFDKHGNPNGFRPDNEAIQRSKLRIETRLKLAAKLLPKIYGDKVQHNHEATGDLAKLLEGASNQSNGLPNKVIDQ